jgi:hypothetical protein
VGAGFTSAPSATASHGAFGLSVIDARGNQWANAVFSADSSNFNETSRYQRTDKGLVSVGGSQSKTAEAAYVPMDSDGFTINYTTAGTSAGQVFSLALKGVQAYAGNFTKAGGDLARAPRQVGDPAAASAARPSTLHPAAIWQSPAVA